MKRRSRVLQYMAFIVAGLCAPGQLHSQRDKEEQPRVFDDFRESYPTVAEIGIQAPNKTDLRYVLGIDEEKLEIGVSRFGFAKDGEELRWRKKFTGGSVHNKGNTLIDRLRQRDKHISTGGLEGQWIDITVWQRGETKQWKFWFGERDEEIVELISWLEDITGIAQRTKFITSEGILGIDQPDTSVR